MARVPNAEKSKYTPIGERKPDGEDTPCFYCGHPSCMEDLTPHPKALDVFKSTFPEEWTRAQVCRKCWGRIYTANIVNHGRKFGAQPGCMTVAQKKQLLGVEEKDVVNSQFTLTADKTMVLPVAMVKFDDGPYLYHGQKVYLEEIEALQGAFLLRLHGLSEHLVWKAFEGAMAAHLDPSREDLFKTILGLGGEEPGDKESGGEEIW